MKDCLLLSCLLALSLSLTLGCKPKPLLPEEDVSDRDFSEIISNNREKLEEQRIQDDLNYKIREFQRIVGRTPTNLTELVKRRIVKEVPKAPPGFRFVYDPIRSNLQMVKLKEQPEGTLQEGIQAPSVKDKELTN